ncbi:MAG: hypothetical protein ACFFCI_01350 [Promethearchaeota archaeon]
MDKGIPAEESPFMTIIIAVSSIVGGIGVGEVSIFLFRKKKRLNEVI